MQKLKGDPPTASRGSEWWSAVLSKLQMELSGGWVSGCNISLRLGQRFLCLMEEI